MLMNGPSEDEFVNLALASLPDQEMHVIMHFFGLGCKPQKLGEIAAEVGATRDRIVLIKNRALRHIWRDTNVRELLRTSLVGIQRHRRWAVSHNRPTWWAEYKYHGVKESD